MEIKNQLSITIDGKRLTTLTDFDLVAHPHNVNVYSYELCLQAPLTNYGEIEAGLMGKSILVRFVAEDGKKKTLRGIINRLVNTRSAFGENELRIIGDLESVAIWKVLQPPPKLMLASAILIPFLLIFFTVYQVVKIQQQLVPQQGTITAFVARGSSRSVKDYQFKTFESQVSYQRFYNGFARIIMPIKTSSDLYQQTKDNTIAEIGHLNPKLKPASERQFTFYILQTDQFKINDPKQVIPYFALKYEGQKTSLLRYYIDLYGYHKYKYYGILIVFISFMLTTLCFASAASRNIKKTDKLLLIYFGFVVLLHWILFVI